MDQDLDEADGAETLHTRVRLASSTSKAPPRVPLLPADADMDVFSLVRLLPLPPNLLSVPFPNPNFPLPPSVYPPCGRIACTRTSSATRRTRGA